MHGNFLSMSRLDKSHLINIYWRKSLVSTFIIIALASAHLGLGRLLPVGDNVWHVCSFTLLHMLNKLFNRCGIAFYLKARPSADWFIKYALAEFHRKLEKVRPIAVPLHGERWIKNEIAQLFFRERSPRYLSLLFIWNIKRIQRKSHFYRTIEQKNYFHVVNFVHKLSIIVWFNYQLFYIESI